MKLPAAASMATATPWRRPLPAASPVLLPPLPSAAARRPSRSAHASRSSPVAGTRPPRSPRTRPHPGAPSAPAPEAGGVEGVPAAGRLRALRASEWSGARRSHLAARSQRSPGVEVVTSAGGGGGGVGGGGVGGRKSARSAAVQSRAAREVYRRAIAPKKAVKTRQAESHRWGRGEPRGGAGSKRCPRPRRRAPAAPADPRNKNTRAPQQFSPTGVRQVVQAGTLGGGGHRSDGKFSGQWRRERAPALGGRKQAGNACQELTSRVWRRADGMGLETLTTKTPGRRPPTSPAHCITIAAAAAAATTTTTTKNTHTNPHGRWTHRARGVG